MYKKTGHSKTLRMKRKRFKDPTIRFVKSCQTVTMELAEEGDEEDEGEKFYMGEDKVQD